LIFTEDPFPKTQFGEVKAPAVGIECCNGIAASRWRDLKAESVGCNA